MNDYITVFEIAAGSTGSPWLSKHAYVIIGMVFLGVGLVAIAGLLCIPRFRRFPLTLDLLAPGFLVISGLVWLSFAPAFFSSYRLADDLYQAYEHQDYEIEEGTVEVLRTQPHEGHAPGDLVRIDGMEFEISFFLMTAAYRQTVSHGGALREGAQARVFHKNGRILRVDIRKGTGQHPLSPRLQTQKRLQRGISDSP